MLSDSFHRVARLARSSRAGASRAWGLALTTRSTAGSSCWCRRKDSRTRRRRRLRATALPARFHRHGQAQTRGCPSPLGFTRHARRIRRRCAGRVRRSRRTRSLLRRRSSRRQCEPPWHRALEELQDRGTGACQDARDPPALGIELACGPWRAGAQEPCGRSWWPCGRGTRGALAAHLARLISAFHMIGSEAADLMAVKKGREGYAVSARVSIQSSPESLQTSRPRSV